MVMGCYDMRGNLWGKPESEISARQPGDKLSRFSGPSLHRPTIGDTLRQAKTRDTAPREPGFRVHTATFFFI
jgi:hypothetical protein